MSAQPPAKKNGRSNRKRNPQVSYEEFGSWTRRRPIGRGYAAAKDAENKKGHMALGIKTDTLRYSDLQSEIQNPKSEIESFCPHSASMLKSFLL